MSETSEEVLYLLDRLGMCAASFVEQADLRLDGEGDFDAYHSARHDLCAVLEELADVKFL